MDGRSCRRVYTDEEKLAALHLVREVGVGEASLRLRISKYTLADWRAQTKACAYSLFVGRGRAVDDAERERLLAQLIHEQEIEMRFPRHSYRHDLGLLGHSSLGALDELLTRTGVVQRHLVEWLDPVLEEVAELLVGETRVQN